MLKNKKFVRQSVVEDAGHIQKVDNKGNYLLVDKKVLPTDKKLTFNLFREKDPTQMSLFLQSNTVLDKEKKEELQDVEQLYINKNEKQQLESFLENNLQDIVQDDSLSLDVKTEIIYASTTELTHSLYSNPNGLHNAKLSENIVTPILDTIVHNEDTISSYIKIIEYDYYTHTHSLNVSIYALCLGTEIGLKKQDLIKLGRAALLHDIGKSRIDPKIVNKQSSLTQEEFAEMQNHPALGHKIALEIGIEDKQILAAIRHHHEKLNGRGYPDHIKDKELSLFPRLIAICDVFDALTTKRSYKDAMRSFDALSLMRKDMNTHLDMKLLSIFIKLLHK